MDLDEVKNCADFSERDCTSGSIYWEGSDSWPFAYYTYYFGLPVKPRARGPNLRVWILLEYVPTAGLKVDFGRISKFVSGTSRNRTLNLQMTDSVILKISRLNQLRHRAAASCLLNF